MRLFVFVFATAALFLVASTAGAVEFSIVGPTEATVLPGEQFTIGIVITNADVTPIESIGASVTNYGANQFGSGQAVGRYLDVICAGGNCFGGLSNLAGPDAGSSAVRTLEETSVGGFGNRVRFALSGAGVPAVGANGAADLGLDGGVGTAQFTVTFTAVESASILVGTAYRGDGLVSGGFLSKLGDQTFSLTVIPEPGTALLMGLGLAGFAAAGWRE